LVQSIPNTGGGVYAMTLCGSRLFVVRHGAHQVDVYDAASLPLTLHGCILVPDLGMVSYGLAASRGTDKCLYVSDYNANVIHHVDLVDIAVDGNDRNTVDDVTSVLAQPRSWLVGKQPAGLSTTDAGSVLVTCYGAGEIQEYRRESRAVTTTTAGHHCRQAMVTMTIVRVMRLLPDVTYPWHTVCLSTDGGIQQYFVTVSGTDHGVCVVNTEGVVDRKFIGNNVDVCGEHSIRMKSPRCVAVCGDSKRRGTLLVADQCNNRILLVNQSLTQALQLPIDAGEVTGSATGSGRLQLPGGLCLDESRGRLYVGEWIGGRVLVYDGVVDYIDSNF